MTTPKTKPAIPTDDLGDADISGLTPAAAVRRSPASHVRFDSWRRALYLASIQRGLGPADAARAAGISVWTVRRHRRADQWFDAAVRRAELTAADAVESALFNAAASGNVRAMIFYLERRCPERWASPGLSVVPASSSPEQTEDNGHPEEKQPATVEELRHQALEVLRGAAAEHDELTLGGSLIGAAASTSRV